MMFLNEESQRTSMSVRKKVAATMIQLLRERFESFDGPVFSRMSWCNLEYWTDNKEFGINELEQFDWQKAIRVETCSTPYKTMLPW